MFEITQRNPSKARTFHVIQRREPIRIARSVQPLYDKLHSALLSFDEGMSPSGVFLDGAAKVADLSEGSLETLLEDCSSFRLTVITQAKVDREVGVAKARKVVKSRDFVPLLLWAGLPAVWVQVVDLLMNYLVSRRTVASKAASLFSRVGQDVPGQSSYYSAP